MKTAKIRKTNKKEEKVEIKQEYSIKKMIILVVILFAIFGIFYVITDIVVDPVEETAINDNNITEIDATKITLNNLLDRKESEYYVLATMESSYAKEANYSEIYQNYINDYSTNENALPFYNVDLDDALNKGYIDEILNISDNIEEIKLNDEVLFKIKDGKIDKYYVGNTEIIDFLSNI